MESGSRMRSIRILVVCSYVFLSVGANAQLETHFFERKSFPSGFVFGVGSSAYQDEGAAQEDGKGLSIWDTFSHSRGKISDESNGDVSNDQYHRYKEDVKLLVNMGVDSYRLSISWVRIFPKGRGAINNKGVAFYNNFINELLRNSIKPVVTIYHWDMPQALQDEYGGFLSPKIVKDFTDYADTCFGLFGDRVKVWTTINEPDVISVFGFNNGTYAPGRCSKLINANCTAGNSATEPYIATHNILLSHASAVKLYRDKYQKTQKGIIGITLNTKWFVPYSDSLLDQKASYRMLDFSFGWFMDPVTKGEYPNSMRALVGERLPRFTKAECELLKESFDYLGLNYYTAQYARDGSSAPNSIISYGGDSKVITSNDRNGVLIGVQAGSNWLHVYPQGIRELLNHIKNKYNNPPVYIMENGRDEINNASMALKESLNDTWRVDYHCQHLSNVLFAIRDGCNVRGYFGWAFMDNFQWTSGYSSRFGFYFVDRANNLTRYAKSSVSWFRRMRCSYPTIDISRLYASR